MNSHSREETDLYIKIENKTEAKSKKKERKRKKKGIETKVVLQRKRNAQLYTNHKIACDRVIDASDLAAAADRGAARDQV